MNNILRTSLVMLLLSVLYNDVFSFDCYTTLTEKGIKYMNWPSLEHCLRDLGDRFISEDIKRNIWTLVKMAFGGLENIPPETYKALGGVLTAIPTYELQNIRMEQVEVVEAFGAIGTIGFEVDISSKDQKNATVFEKEQMNIVAQKVRYEWLGKTPKTYSEYDLMLLGNIVCYLNVSDIKEIHGDAFRLAAEKIGTIHNCPQESLQAFATLAKLQNAFGHPSTWSKVDLSIIGNIINGLSEEDIDSIDESKLYLNHYYVAKRART